MSRSRACGTCSRAMPASSRSGSMPMSASAPICCSGWRCSRACIRWSRSRSPASPRRSISVPVALLMFRLRGHYFAIGTWVMAEVFRLSAAQVSALDGGSGTSLPAAVVLSIAGTRADARVRRLLDRAGARRRHARRHRAAAALALRPCAHRDPRQRARRALERRRRRARQIPGLCRGGVRHRHGRRADLPAEDPHLARHRVLGQRLDRLRDLHHRDRRHRPHRGADHRHRRVLPAAADAGRPRRDLPADPRRGRDRGDAEGAEGPVGPGRRPLRLAAVPAGAAAGDRRQ